MHRFVSGRALLLGLTSVMAGAVLVGSSGCGGGGGHPPMVEGRAISHAPTSGVEGFFFLPPLAPEVSYSGRFDPTLTSDLKVDVFLSDENGNPAGDPIATFTGGVTHTSPAETIRLDATDEHYIVNWRTDEYNLSEGATYRVSVRRASDDYEYGFAEVQVFTSMKEGKTIGDDSTFALKDGRTLPVRFRIEEGAEPRYEIISPRTRVIPNDGSVILESIAGTTYTFSGAVPSIAPGDIIIGSTQAGYLRRVQAVSTTADRTIVDTSEAELCDVVYRGSLTMRLDSGSGDVGLAGAFTALQSRDPGWRSLYEFSQITIYRSDEVDVRITSGSIGFTPQIVTDMRFDRGELKYFRVSAAGRTTVDLNVRADAFVAGEWSKEVKLPPGIDPPPIVLWQFIPGTPVPVVEVVDLDFFVGMKLNAEVTGMTESEFSADASVELGAEYSGSWRPIATHSLDVDGEVLTFELRGEADLRGYLKAKLSVAFYGVAGPWVDLKPYVRLHGYLEPPTCYWAALFGGLTSDFGLDLGVPILDASVALYNARLLEWETDIGRWRWCDIGSREIAFVTDRDGNAEIYVMSASGGNQTNLTNSSAWDGTPAWSPDGSRIAFTSERDGNVEIYVMNSDGTGQTNLTRHWAYDVEPSWCPDGSKIAFESKRYGGSQIWVMNADGTNPRQLTAIGPSIHPAWSPTGTRIAFVSRGYGDDIYAINPDGTGRANLTRTGGNDSAPAWSPDGSKIAFNSDRDGNYEIYVMNADGSDQTKVTNDPAHDASPTWSPDGRRIAFWSDRDGNFEIYVMSADGSGVRRLTSNAARDWDPDWSWSLW